MLKIVEVKSLMTELVNDIHTYENDKNKGYEFEFDYYDSKQFKELEKKIEKRNEGKDESKQEHLNIIGNINLKKPVKIEDYEDYKDDEEKEITLLKVKILDVDADYEQFYTYFEVTPPDETETYGYVRVGKFDYIRIEDGMAAAVVTTGRFGRTGKRLVKFVAYSFIITAILFGAYKGLNYVNDTYDIGRIVDKYIRGIDVTGNDTTDETISGNQDEFTGLEQRQEKQAEIEYIEVAGYANLLVYDEHQEIDLINLPNNTVFQKYTVYFNGDKVFETGLIEPGKVVKWNAYECLPNGQHKVIFDIETYDYIVDENGNVSAGGACNGATQDIEIECRK